MATWFRDAAGEIRLVGTLYTPGATTGDVLTAQSDGSIAPATPAVPSATVGGDLSGTLPNPTVAKVNGVTVTGTPNVGDVPTATSASAASWAPGGGSQPLRKVKLDVEFDTVGLVIPASGPAGLHLTDVDDLETLLSIGPDNLMNISPMVAWDGDNPTFNLCTTAGRGNLPGTPPVPFLSVGTLDNPDTDDSTTGAFRSNLQLNPEAGFYFTPATAIYAYIDDGAGGDPGSMQGSGRIVLWILDTT